MKLRLIGQSVSLKLEVSFCYDALISLLDSDEDTSERSTDEDHLLATLDELTDLHFNFEVKEVCLFLDSVK